MQLRHHIELGSAANLTTVSHLAGWQKPKLRHGSFAVVVNPEETVLGSMQKELKDEGIDIKDAERAAQDAENAELKELNLKKLQELKQEPQDPNRHEFVVPRMPKKTTALKDEEPRAAERSEENPPNGPPAPLPSPSPGPPLDLEAPEPYDEGYEEGYEEVPLLDQDLEKADIRYDSKVDPQLNRIADQVNAKIDMVEERLLGNRLQNLVVPFPASDASRDASTVHVFLGNPSTTTPDVGTPLDEVNQLLQKADSIEKGLVATSNLQMQGVAPIGLCAGLLMAGHSSFIYRSQMRIIRTAGFL